MYPCIGTGVESRRQNSVPRSMIKTFHRFTVFEPESPKDVESLRGCHVLPACSLVPTRPVADDVSYSDCVFSIQRIRQFHRVHTANLIETVTFRQSCRRQSSRHRSCHLLSAFELTLPENSSTASTVPQCATKFSNCWVPQIDVGSQPMTLLCGRWGFLIHFGLRYLVCAIKFFGKIRFSVRGGCECFHWCHELLVGCVAQSLYKLSFAAGGLSPPANGTVLRCVTVLPWKLPLAGCVLTEQGKRPDRTRELTTD